MRRPVVIAVSGLVAVVAVVWFAGSQDGVGGASSDETTSEHTAAEGDDPGTSGGHPRRVGSGGDRRGGDGQRGAGGASGRTAAGGEPSGTSGAGRATSGAGSSAGDDESSATRPASAARGGPGSVGPPEIQVGDAADASGGVLAGRVVRAGSNRGVVGAELSFARAGGVSSVVTTEGGAFEFAPPAPGLYELVAVTAEGHLPYAPAWGHSPVVFQARARERIDGIVVPLTPAIRYAGRVVDDEARPVAGAEIQILGVGGGAEGLAPMQDRFTSDADGRFAFQARNGTVVEARHPDFVPGRATVELATQVSRRLVITLRRKSDKERRSGAISGVVTDADRRPISGALVIAAASSGESPEHRTVTDPGGAFRFDPIDEGTYRVTASTPGLVASSRDAVQTGAPALQFVLTKGGAIRGRVLAGERALTAFLVWIGLDGGGVQVQRYLSRAFYDSEGRFEVRGLGTGRYRVMVVARGYAVAVKTGVTIDARVQEPLELDFSLTEGGRLVGVVLTEGTHRPIDGATVALEGLIAFDRGVLSDSATAVTTSDGNFELLGVSPGVRSVVVSASGHHSRIVGGLEFTAGALTGPKLITLTPLGEGEDPRLELIGIGAELAPQGAYLEVRRVLAGGGALEAGLAAGDRIFGVDGRGVVEAGFGAVINAIRGSEGTSVILSVGRAPEFEPVDVSVFRRKIKQ